MPTGLVIVITGNGSVTSAAALGIVLRSCGHRMQVSLIRFMHGAGDRGEERGAELLKPDFELVVVGRDDGVRSNDAEFLERRRKAAVSALSLARQRITSGFWDVVILEEITTAADFGFVSVTDILALLREKPDKLHVVLTGRDASAALVEQADVVTNIRDVKNPSGAKATPQRGIDY